MRSKSGQFFPTAGGLTSRREVLRYGGAIAAVSVIAPTFPRFARAATATTTFDYYISTTGSDSNPGTLAQPWALTSLASNSSNLAKIAGKRVGIIAGNYTINSDFPTANSASDYTASWLNLPSGTAGSPTYIASCDASGQYQARAATISWGGGGSPYAIFGNYPTSNDSCQYITLDGLVINGNSMQAYSLGGGNYGGMHLVHFYNASYSRSSSNNATITGLTVQNCEIYSLAPNQPGQNNALLFLVGCYDCIVQNNYLHDVAPTGAEATANSGNPSHCALVAEIGCYSNQYLYNTFQNSPGGIWEKEGNTGTIAAYNYFHNIGGGGVYGANEYCSPFMGWDDNAGAPNTGPAAALTYLIHHNVIDGCTGAHFNVDSAPGSRNSITAYNNTVYDTLSASYAGWMMGCQGSANSQYYNNIYVTTNNGPGGGSLQSGKLNVNTTNFSNVDHNCYYSVGGSYTSFWGVGSTTYNDFATYQAAIQSRVAGSESHAMQSNPDFAQGIASIVSGAGAAQFQLSEASALIAAGSGGVHIGAWDGTTTQIGCSFSTGSAGSASPVPEPPAGLTVS